MSCRNCRNSKPSLPLAPSSSLPLALPPCPFLPDNCRHRGHCGNRLSCWKRRNCRCGLLPERAFPLVVSLLSTMVADVSGWCRSGSSFSPGASDLLPDPLCTLIYLLYEPVRALLEVHQGLLFQVVK